MEPESMRRKRLVDHGLPGDEGADSFLKLQVSLPSGRCATLSILLSGSIGDLKVAAPRVFGARILEVGCT